MQDSPTAHCFEITSAVADGSKKIPCLRLYDDGKTQVKTLHLIRHGEATSNAASILYGKQAYDSEEYLDAILTDKGRTQCAALKEKVNTSEMYSNIELVAVSPLRRALMTAVLGLEPYKHRVPWIALEYLRETTGSHPCDRRLSRTETSASFPDVSFAEITADEDPLYAIYNGKREPVEHVVARGRQFLAWLSRRKEKVVAVVSHSSFMDYFLEHVLETAPENAVRLNNCEVRTFVVTLPVPDY